MATSTTLADGSVCITYTALEYKIIQALITKAMQEKFARYFWESGACNDYETVEEMVKAVRKLTVKVIPLII